MNKEIGISFEPSTTQLFGLREKERKEVRSYLGKRLLRVLNQLPFSSEETSDLPILKIEHRSQTDRVILPGYEKALSVSTIEKLMDGVLMSRATFEGIYKYGPVKRTKINSVEKNYQRGYKTYDFLVRLNGGREYVVRKKVDYVSYVRNGKIVDRKGSFSYIASLPEFDLLTQMTIAEDASGDFGLGRA